MALTLKFTVENGNDCKSIIFTETTGAYNNPNNLTGWGSPNAAIADVATAVLTIENLTTATIYDNITITPSSTNGETTITTQDLEVGSISIGDITLPDGLYEFTYTVTMDDDTVYIQTVKSLFLCESCCKIKKLATNVDIDCGCCNDDCSEEVWNFLEAHTLYKALQWSGICGSETEINSNILNLQEYLININCKNC